MDNEFISNITNIILVAHTVLLYPIARYAFTTEKRLTRIETKLDLS